MKGSTIRVDVVRSLLIFATFMILSGWMTELLALADEASDQSLEGLKALAVMVSPTGPDGERNGLKWDQMQSGIEQKLRKVGLRILTNAEIEKRGFPYLSVITNVTKDKNPNVYSYDIKVVLYKQYIMNTEDAQENLGFALYNADEVWSSEQNGTAPGSDLKSNVQKQLDDIVDKFAAAYSAANPQKKDKP